MSAIIKISLPKGSDELNIKVSNTNASESESGAAVRMVEMFLRTSGIKDDDIEINYHDKSKGDNENNLRN